MGWTREKLTHDGIVNVKMLISILWTDFSTEVMQDKKSNSGELSDFMALIRNNWAGAYHGVEAFKKGFQASHLEVEEVKFVGSLDPCYCFLLCFKKLLWFIAGNEQQ